MQKRSGKFYSKNEKQTLKLLGLNPVPMSGAGWIAKEDGENDKFICQLKSTDSDSYRIHKLDLEKLIYHSEVSHKIPIFIIQFLQDNSLFALVEVKDLDKFLNLKSPIAKQEYRLEESDQEVKNKSKRVIKSGSSNSRKEFYEGREKQWKQQKSLKQKQ